MKTVSASKLSILRMAAGQEKNYSKVVDTDGNLKEWVGIGWITLRKATAKDRKRYHNVEGA